MTAHECKTHDPNCWRCDLSRAELGTDGKTFQQCEHGFHHPSWPHSCDGCYGCDVPQEYRREPSVPPVASYSPGPVPEVPLRSYADPIANAEVQRLRAENERLLTELDRYDGEAWDSLRAKLVQVERRNRVLRLLLHARSKHVQTLLNLMMEETE